MLTGRCADCGRRWCICAPAGASVDYHTAVTPAPVHGPDRRAMDTTQEVLEAVADIAALPTSQWSPHIRSLATSYSSAQLVEALLVAMERIL